MISQFLFDCEIRARFIICDFRDKFIVQTTWQTNVYICDRDKLVHEKCFPQIRSIEIRESFLLLIGLNHAAREAKRE